ncbi:MAG TPA: hypothetical protein VF691_17625 [Cytophagaceae bacterium]|jgi:hypothetical protein
MKIPAIKKLVESYTIAQLKTAEENLLEEENMGIEVEGSDEGEILTHIIAAVWILEEMKSKDLEFKEALREYTKKVRESIS